MKIRIVEGDVLGQRGDAVVIPIDGLINGRINAKIADRQLGNVGHQFMRQYEDAELAKEIADQVTFPLPLGRAALLELPKGVSPFRWVVLVCTLSHLGDLSKPVLTDAAASAFTHALELCHAANIASVATPLLTGGWRLALDAAAQTVFRVLRHAPIAYSFEVAICASSGADRIREIGMQTGLTIA